MVPLHKNTERQSEWPTKQNTAPVQDVFWISQDSALMMPAL